MKHVYVLTYNNTNTRNVFTLLTGVTSYIDDVTGPIFTDIDYIDDSLKSDGIVNIPEGWTIEICEFHRLEKT